jgi:hypothetical protein
MVLIRILFSLSCICFFACGDLMSDDILGLTWLDAASGDIIFFKDGTYRASPGLGYVGDYSYDRKLKKGVLHSRAGTSINFYINSKRDLVFEEMNIQTKSGEWVSKQNVVFSRKSAKLMYSKKPPKQ